MDEHLESFFALARSIGLSPNEKMAVLQAFSGSLTKDSDSIVRNLHDVRHTGQMSLSDQRFTGKARSAIRLSPHEKDSIFQSIQEFMKANPYHQQSQMHESSWSFFDFFREFKLVPVLASVLILVIGAGGTVSYAAQSSLPGDALYPVKIYVNEPVQVSFAFSSEAKARLETRLTQARLEEAEELALESRLDEDQAVFLSERIAKHSERARLHVAVLHTKGQNDVAADIDEKLHASLMAHDSALQKVAHSRRGARKHIAVLIKGVRAISRGDDDDHVVAIAAALPSEINEEATTKTFGITAIHKNIASVQGASSSITEPIVGVTDRKGEAKIDLVKSRIAAVRSSVERRNKQGEVTVGSDSQGRINAAESALEQAGVKLRAGSSKEADQLRVESLQHVEEAELFLEIDAKLGASDDPKDPNHRAAHLLLKNAQKKLKDAWVALRSAQTEGSALPEILGAAETTLNEAQKITDESQIKFDAALYRES